MVETTESTDQARPTRVAIVGGGCAALTAAYELTRPELAGRFEVTVYQMGWRLGGKGASGRGARGRIEEHGLHLWMGYYENAFRLMRQCYAELADHPDGTFWEFSDAFSPTTLNGAMDWTPSGKWLPWKVKFPAAPGLPGDPDAPRMGIADYLIRAASLLQTLLQTLPTSDKAPDGRLREKFSDLGQPLSADDLGTAVTRLTKYGTLAGLEALLEGAAVLEAVLTALPSYPQSLVARLLEVVTDLMRRQLQRLVAEDDELRRLWEVIELILASIRGCVRDRLAFDPRGFDAIDRYDCREWLRRHGASEMAINSAFIRALYDLAFAYEAGNPKRPAIAAGSALRGAFRCFFSYRGAFFWRMNAGMGDVVFSPLYLALKRRGVHFEFFHKLTNLGLGPLDEPPHIASLAFDVQARTTSAEEYSPLVDVKGIPCWPSKPDYAQLERGDELESRGVDLESQADPHSATTKRLTVGHDFDIVVLGVALGVIPHVCSEILQRDERWRMMVATVKSVPTQAFQLWLDRDISQLGWEDGSANMSGFVEPFDTWADMTHLAGQEAWESQPRSIAYFCNVLPDAEVSDKPDPAEFVSEQKDLVRNNCVRFLREDVQHLWPKAHDEGDFVWQSLMDPTSTSPIPTGASRFDTQYWTANVKPSDRYSQALPGSTQYRISPLERTYDNLTVAGDWTACSLNMGCVEAAVISGLLAAHAVSGVPALEDIVGYDHP